MANKDHNTRVPRPHHNYVAEYQMSGIPHVETKVLPASANDAALNVAGQIDKYKFTFDSVTRWIEIHNHGENGQQHHLRIYFNRTAALKAYSQSPDDHYYLIDEESTTDRLEIKCKEVYLIPHTSSKTFTASIIAGLTNVSAEDFPDQQYDNGFTGIEDNPNPQNP
jgi:hypothetical protein